MARSRRVRRCRTVGNRSMTIRCWNMGHWAVCHRQVGDTMTVKVRQMQSAEAASAEHKRKETEAKTDRETDQVKI